MSAGRTGVFDISADVGRPGIRGSTVWDPDRQTYRITGGGENVWGTSDQLHLAAMKVRGDFILTAEAALEGSGGAPHRKTGLTVRVGLDASSPHADATVHGDGLTSLQYRDSSGADTREVKAVFEFAEVLQLERAGADIVMRAAKRGDPLVETGRITLSLPAAVLAGIYVCSHDGAAAETASFRNIRLDVPAPVGLDAHRRPAASRLEMMEVDTGHRRIRYADRSHIEAPNWSRDGSFLLFNREGRIHRLSVDRGKPTVLDTAQVRANNNDHGISFDGKWLALSSHTAQPGRKAGSQIYVVGIDGGRPVKVTDQAPSYWHGWSPDGERLVYCAEREGNYDVWSIATRGGVETRLTTDPGLDDGPEYSPDGAYIYFNSTRTGRMKIWRMRPDGSGQEPVSFDEYHDWFAHPSPDGKRLVYVSYPPAVPANLHPPNQRVMIREQDLSSGKVRVLAHLYGGQGTMNVPSWSPDGRSVAFVSYTYGRPER